MTADFLYVLTRHIPAPRPASSVPRPHDRHNALSPLQSFSPLFPPASPKMRTSSSSSSAQISHSGSTGSLTAMGRSGSQTPEAAPGGEAAGGRSRSTSLTNKPTRRESMGLLPNPNSLQGSNVTTPTPSSSFQGDYGFGQGGSFSMSGMSSPAVGKGAGGRENREGGMISKLTLVRAPSKGKKGKDAGAQGDGVGLKKRSKSSSNLTPFTALAMSGLPTSASNSSTISSASTSPSSRAPRVRLPGSFSLTGDNFGPASPGGVGAAPTRSNLFGTSGSNQNIPLNIHEERAKVLSPEEVVELAEHLRSPILAADDDEGQGLSRSGSFRRSRTGSFVSLKNRKFGMAGEEEGGSSKEKEKEAEHLELEPVEYVEMNDDVLLPFVDRPTEVSELVQHPNNVEIFDILSLTFPSESVADPTKSGSWRSVPPTSWNWHEFQLHLQETRGDCDDFEWIKRARAAVRARSEALWEKVGVCLGCDGDLLNAGEDRDGVFGVGAGGEDEFDSPLDGGLNELEQQIMAMDNAFGFDGDEDGRSQVWVEGIVPAESNYDEGSRSRSGSVEGLADSDGEIIGGIRMDSPQPGGMETIGEEDHHHAPGTQSKLTTAQIAGGRGDPQDSLDTSSPLIDNLKRLPPLDSHDSSSDLRKSRTKSFVGLQILTMPSLPAPANNFHSAPTYAPGSDHPHFERGPGSPLFPSSFAALSLAPTLPNNNPNLRQGRMSFGIGGGALDASGGGKAENVRGGGPPGPRMDMMGGRPWMELTRRRSGQMSSRMSDSALTMGSDGGDEELYVDHHR